MGKLTSGILGPVSGKVAGVVGGRWKDRQYLRGYTIPANPNSAKQQAQRGKLADCVAFCKPLVGPVFNEYYDKFLPGMSGFNAFISANIDKFTASPTFTNMLLGSGKLYLGAIVSAVYTSVSGDLTITFPTATGNNGLATDEIYPLCYDKSTGFWYFGSITAVRSEGSVSMDTATGLTVANLTAYILAAQYNDSDVLMMVSDSKASAVSAA